jgi:hypothetical protein
LNNSFTSPSLLIIGGTKAGKSHYGGQLLRRLQTKKYSLQIVGSPSDLSPFKEVLDQLALGRSASHTPSGFYRESIWQVQRSDGSNSSELIWPDYAGEQIEEVVKNRQVGEQWMYRIRASSAWLLFVRLRPEMESEDILVRPRKLERMQSAPEAKNSGVEPAAGSANALEAKPELPRLTFQKQAGLIELLQALLFIKQVGTTNQLHHPPLVVVISCWDEIPSPKSAIPAEVLKSHLPLLSQFIETTWQSKSVDIIGLSALGKPLKDDVSDDEFMDDGPERQGWCISTDGKQVDDLTLPIVALMDKVGPGR